MTPIEEAVRQLSPAQRQALLARIDTGLAFRRFDTAYPDTGPLRRELYDKHLQFFAAGCDHLERALLGANRSGKTFACGYEVAAHLMGRYAPWWNGFRFNRPITAWIAGTDVKAVRESCQVTLFGEAGKPGTGLLPANAIVATTTRPGVSGAIDSAVIRHSSGSTSRLMFKSYDQRRPSFQGAKIDLAWADEEPPSDIYSELLTRLMSTTPGEPAGRMLCSFTPLLGLSLVVLGFLPGGKPKDTE